MGSDPYLLVAKKIQQTSNPTILGETHKIISKNKRDIEREREREREREKERERERERESCDPRNVLALLHAAISML